MNKIASIYANSLFEIAIEEKVDKDILEEIISVKEIIRLNPKFIQLLDAPMVSSEEKQQLINDIFKGNINIYLLNYIKVILDRKVVLLLDESLTAFQQLYNKHYNIENVTATTAVKLSPELCEKLILKLEKITQKTILLENKVDASCIGGIILKFSDKQIDQSLAAKLKDLKAELTRV